MAISGRPSRRDLGLRMGAWAGVMVTYLTLWSAGLGWMAYWWAWLFVLLPVCLSGLTWRRPGPRQPRPRRRPGWWEGPAGRNAAPRVRFPTSHRRRRAVR